MDSVIMRNNEIDQIYAMENHHYTVYFGHYTGMASQGFIVCVLDKFL